MPSSAGKRQREQQKLEKARAKADRKAARQEAPEPVEVPTGRTEPELIDDLRRLHEEHEAGEVSAEEFEERRDRIQAQLEQLQ